MRAPERGTTYKTRGRRGARRVHGQTHRRTGQKGEAALPAGRPAHPRPARRTRHQPRTDRLALRLLMGHATPQHRRPGLLRVRQELDRLRPGASDVPQPVPFPLHPRPRPRGGMASGRRQAPRTVQTAQTLQRVHGPRARSNGCSTRPRNASAASCSSSWNTDTTPAAPCSPPNTPKRTGTNDSEAAPTPTPSWTGSCTTPPG